jgi:hypothetical protein
VARVERSRAIELRGATFRINGAALLDGGNRHLVADAQRVAVRRRCFPGRCRSDLPDAEPDDGGGYKHRGQNEVYSLGGLLLGVRLILVEKAVPRLGQCAG